MSDQSRGLHILRKLKALGVVDRDGRFRHRLLVAGDAVHAFPFDKPTSSINFLFVKRLPSDAAAAAIVRTVLALGESLGMPVLAEGIETQAQWQFLVREGCDTGQGYLFAEAERDQARLPGVIAAAICAGFGAPGDRGGAFAAVIGCRRNTVAA